MTAGVNFGSFWGDYGSSETTFGEQGKRAVSDKSFISQIHDMLLMRNQLICVFLG